MLVFPGQYIGQLISYAQAIYKGHLWGMSINVKEVLNNMQWFEWLLYALNVYTWTFLTGKHMLIYAIMGNAVYHIAIIPDHDTYECAVEHKYSGRNFLQRQIENSGNFSNNNFVYTHLFGGINY